MPGISFDIPVISEINLFTYEVYMTIGFRSCHRC